MGRLWSDFNKIRNRNNPVGMNESNAEHYAEYLTKAAFLEILMFGILAKTEIRRSIALKR